MLSAYYWVYFSIFSAVVFLAAGVHDLMQESMLETTLYLSSLASAAHERIIDSIVTFGDFVLFCCCTVSVFVFVAVQPLCCPFPSTFSYFS